MAEKMKTQTCLSIWVVLLLLIVLTSGCAREKVRPPKRTYVQDHSTNQAGTPPALPPYINQLWRPGGPTSCKRLEDLERSYRISDRGFSLFKSFDSYSKMASIDLQRSPFVQYFIGNQFTVLDDTEFYEQAQTDYEKGELPSYKWFVLKSLRVSTQAKIWRPEFMRQWWDHLYSSTKLSAHNDKLNEAFPGIFGESAKYDNSFLLRILIRSQALAGIEPKRKETLLTAMLPLFDAESWQDLPDETSTTLRAALKGWYHREVTTPDEKLCSFILFQRALAQILALNGYEAPVAIGDDNYPLHYARLQKLSTSNQRFLTRPVGGVLVDPHDGIRVVASPQVLQSYDPATQPQLEVTKELPWHNDIGVETEPGDTEALLSLMETMAHFYQLTSPTAPWVTKTSYYMLGDISPESDQAAILPEQMHALALGLLSLTFKNLAFKNIKTINVHGQLTSNPDETVGIVLGSPRVLEQGYTTLKLSEVLRLTRVTVNLKDALDDLAAGDVATLKKLNSLYQTPVLQSLVGKIAPFPSSQKNGETSKPVQPEGGQTTALPESNKASTSPPSENSESLQAKLQKLMLPLSLLINEMAYSEKGCMTQMDWNLHTGRKALSEPCSSQEREKAKETVKDLALKTNSRLLFMKAVQ